MLPAMTAEPRDAATPLLAESLSPGKLGHAPTAATATAGPATRIGAIVAAATAELPPGGTLIEVGYDRGAILLGALAARPDARAIGVEIQTSTAATMPPDPRCTWLTGDGFDPLGAGADGDPGADGHVGADGDDTLTTAVGILAGMGGRTIAAILERTPALTRRFAALVLCPSHLEADIRPALTRLGIAIHDERLVFERGRYYEVIVARSDLPCTPAADATLAAWGPRLFARRDPLLGAFLDDARQRFRAAFAEDLKSYRSGAKAALGDKLARLDDARSRSGDPR